MHIVVMGFCKAFDLVHRTTLLAKLAAMGIRRSFGNGCKASCHWDCCPNLVELLQGHLKVELYLPLFKVHINSIEDGIPSDLSIETYKYIVCGWLHTKPACVFELRQNAGCDIPPGILGWRKQMELNAEKTKDLWISFKRTNCLSNTFIH